MIVPANNKPKACACYYAKNHFIWRRRAKTVKYRIGGFGSGSTISIATWHRKRKKLNSNRDVISRILFWGCSGWWRKILGILCYFKFDRDSINVISRRPSPKPKQLTKPMKLPRIFDLHCVCARCLLTFIRIGKSIYTCVCAIYYVKPFYVLIPISLKRERKDSQRQSEGGVVRIEQNLPSKLNIGVIGFGLTFCEIFNVASINQSVYGFVVPGIHFNHFIWLHLPSRALFPTRAALDASKSTLKFTQMRKKVDRTTFGYLSHVTFLS